jgi:hypothetical protein
LGNRISNTMWRCVMCHILVWIILINAKCRFSLLDVASNVQVLCIIVCATSMFAESSWGPHMKAKL